MAKLFDPFERLGAEHLGIRGNRRRLTIAKNLVERMGGTLEAFSAVGEGSTFEDRVARDVGPQRGRSFGRRRDRYLRLRPNRCAFCSSRTISPNLILIENVLGAEKVCGFLLQCTATGLDLRT